MYKGAFLLIYLLLWQGAALADVYKYKDKQGYWQFSDKPVKSTETRRLNHYKTATLSRGSARDFSKQLNDKYQLENAVQRATLAVVTVKSQLGNGSGFFVSEDCYLITNKHVVRPAKGKGWEETQDKLNNSAKQFEHTRLKLLNEQDRLAVSKQKLDDFKRYLDQLSSVKQRAVAQREYTVYRERYQQNKVYLDDFMGRFNDNEQKFQRQRSDFNFSSSLANVTQVFELILKDNTRIQANLIKVSESDDLALLKVKACQSPFLTLATTGLSQGEVVHAIGSPLGLRDQVTKGTVTHVSAKGIMTDAQILPGNSGGPLIDDKGYVVAVNTMKVAKGSALNKGFGVSIPATKIRDNFSSYLR